mgnify:CR=1 FL=1|tara:strand:- start:226 stop:636 length:411 start_codon:yes stop_codon:yes gene_type:complete
MFQGSKKGKRNQIGAWGEEIAVVMLQKRGFRILERNHLRKWGEIDIIASKSRVIHFVEVKTVSYETKTLLNYAVAHETWRPEEQVHHFKLKKLYRVVETWIMENEYNGEWQLDIVAVRVVPREKYATWQYFDNIIE